MSNQTIAQIPYDVADPTSLNRFLRELVDNLDVILGYKGSSEGYVSNKEQQEVLTNIRDQLATLTSDNTDNKKDIADIKTSLEDLQQQVDDQNVTATQPALGSAYYDFNAVAWQTLKGAFYLTADGALLANTPFGAVAGTVYEVAIRSTDAAGTAYQVLAVGKSPVHVYARWGVGNAWSTLG